MLRKLREQSRIFRVSPRLSTLLKDWLQPIFAKSKATDTAKPAIKAHPLVKSSTTPKRQDPSLDYRLCTDTNQADGMFNKLSDWFQEESLRLSIENPDKLFFEKGQLAGHQPYFFVQKPQEEGYLFYANEIGWQVFRAHKIVATDTFVRSAILFDSVAIYLNSQQGFAKARLVSDRFFNSDQVPFELYRTRLHQHLIQRLVA